MNALNFDTLRQPGSLARAIANAPRRVDLSKMSGEQQAKSLMLAQLAVEPSRVKRSESQKLSSAERRAEKMRLGKLSVEKLNGA